jgi:hypothetical protein
MPKTVEPRSEIGMRQFVFLDLRQNPKTFTRQTQYRGTHFFRQSTQSSSQSDAETRRIGFAQPSFPGSVAAFVVPHANGKAKAVGAPGSWVYFLALRAPMPACVVRFF